MDIAHAYDLIAEGWNDANAMNDWSRTALESFCAGLPKGADILDVGCGPGRFVAAFGEMGYRATGIDISPKMIDLARKKAPGAELHVMDMRAVGSLNRSFDGIYVCASLLHLPRLEAPEMLRRLNGVCRTDGRFYLSVMKPLPNKPLERVLKEDRYGRAVERFYSHFQPEEIVSMLAGIGRRPIWDRHTSLRDTTWYEIVAA